jgi:hypothetical protein
MLPLRMYAFGYANVHVHVNVLRSLPVSCTSIVFSARFSSLLLVFFVLCILVYVVMEINLQKIGCRE